MQPLRLFISAGQIIPRLMWYARLRGRACLSSLPSAPANDFATYIPDFLQASNGLRCRYDDPDMTELVAAMLECVGLLRWQRRVFVSYRRVESRAAALQLHDLLTARRFDVFLDTHEIRPGDSFQDVLWHRLCDSDVMLMLDTPTYFDSKWTRQEIGRANAKGIHVLRIVWPDHKPNKFTDLAETIYLTPAELEGANGPIVDLKANEIVLAVERLRGRSIASRYMAITGRLRADVGKDRRKGRRHWRASGDCSSTARRPQDLGLPHRGYSHG